MKRTFPKPINLSPTVLLDRERCIVCQRCTRFADEIAGDPFIELLERGAQQQIGIAEDAPFLSYFSGNVIQICPVGALTSEQYRFRSRPFDLVSTPGVAEHDACGSAIRIDHRRGKVLRRQSGNDPAVNEEWITDKDRFAFAYAQSDDRLTYPQVRDDDGSLRPASWPEAFAVAARGLAAAKDAGGVGVLTGGRLTMEDARAYKQFSRTVLATDDVDFRARPLSAEETAFLEQHVKGSGLGVRYEDLESATKVVLVGLEPEDEAGAIFLRLRKSVLAGGTEVIALSPYTTRGLAKLAARVIPTAPGEEAVVLEALATEVDAATVVLLGERLAISPGALRTAARIAASSGARLAWVPRRAGDRGAVEAGLFPGKGGRDANEIVAAVLDGNLRGLLVGGVDPDDTSDPGAFRFALEAADFVVSLEMRPTAVTAAADVVFPVAATSERAGSFVNWEGRRRAFPQAMHRSLVIPDRQVLTGISKETRALGGSAGPRPGGSAQVRGRILAEKWAAESGSPAESAAGYVRPFRLASWRVMLDDGSLQEGNPALRSTARPVVARLSPTNLHRFGPVITVAGDRGSLTVPAVVAVDLADDVVWLPARSTGAGLLADVASPGTRVEVCRA
ncbi:hypothetical protein ASD81_24585 [Nocardioides sp. Root614]|nr:hypothetical protein ASD81_24585 [Nocardioides sp. Root614]KRA85556.1 hypothetical protein ASD84_24595 [Nocardioides sp. Root682]